MDNLKIGEIITTTQFRDAIHIAVAPVIAGERLFPGQEIRMRGGKAFATGEGESLGIVDPFLRQAIHPEQRFWIFLHPGSITSLRHHWEHPAMAGDTLPDVPPPREFALPNELWLQDFADNVGLTFAELMEGAKDWIDDGDYLNRGGLLAGVDVPPSFWTHYEAVTGRKVPAKKQQNFFSCSC
jgi:hypothetical protein